MMKKPLSILLALVLSLHLAVPALAAQAPEFSDVPTGHWAYAYVRQAAQAGAVNGVGNGRFNPEGVLTNEEFLTIMGRMARFLNFALDDYGEAVERSPLPAGAQAMLADYSDWAKSGVAVLAWGLADALEGQGDMLYTSFADIVPSAPVLREEAAAGMYAVLAGLDILP